MNKDNQQVIFIMKIYGYIYLITNLINYKMYIGKHMYNKIR